MRNIHEISLPLLLASSLALLGACGGEEEAESGSEATEASGEETTAAAEPAAEAEEEAPAESACARVSSCCETMGMQWGGGSQRDCTSTAEGGDEQACSDYLARNQEINGTADHPLQGRVFPECMPAE